MTSKLNEHAAFDTYQRVNANLASQLITNTCEKASGVFLWVTLVTMSLLEGLTEGENFTELQERLDSLPTDLEELFKKLLFSLEEQHLRRASQYLQIRRAYPFRMTLLDLCVADSDDAELALKPLGNDFQGDKGAANCELMCRRLNASCKGLLDLTKYPSKALEGQEVDYLHRTVKDYLWRTEIWKKICATTPDTFDLSLRLYNVIMAQVQVGLQKRGDNSSSAKITEMVKLARNARTNEPNWNNRLLDAADASLALRYQSDLSMLTWGQLTMCTDNFLDAVTADQTEALATEQLVSALRKYETFTAYPLEVKLQLQARNARLIEVLFRHEANPYFCWDRVLRREFPGVGIDLIMMFLNNGADARNDLLKDWLRNDKDGALTAFMKKKKKESSVWRYFRK